MEIKIEQNLHLDIIPLFLKIKYLVLVFNHSYQKIKYLVQICNCSYQSFWEKSSNCPGSFPKPDGFFGVSNTRNDPFFDSDLFSFPKIYRTNGYFFKFKEPSPHELFHCQESLEIASNNHIYPFTWVVTLVVWGGSRKVYGISHHTETLATWFYPQLRHRN